MKKLILSRLLEAFFTLLIATLIIFLLIQFAPSDPITIMLSKPEDSVAVDSRLLEQKISELKKEHGLDKNIIVQYFSWLKRLIHFDMGKSIVTGISVKDSIFKTLPKTLWLAVISIIIQLLFSMILAILSVLHFSKFIDHVIRLFTVMLKSFPSFAISLIVLNYFATKLYVYEISSSGNIKRLWLPAITAGIIMIPKLTRIIRSSILDELGKIYILASISRGYTKLKVLKDAMRNSFIQIFTLLSISFASSVGGFIITEAIFSWPGIGKYGIDSVMSQDYTAIQGYTFTIIVLVITVNLISDITYIILNPSVSTGTLK